jgi:2-oxoglutarate ferredoxin oxidoreductase subunit beta
MEGTVTKTQPFGVFSERLNPMAMAIALDCSFVARSFSGDTAHLKETIMAAINHKGFSLVDILQPCVTFNKVNTFEWYRKRVYHIESEYNPEDRVGAFSRALEWGDRIPIGVIYNNNRPVLEEMLPVIAEKPLVKQGFDKSILGRTLKEFY